MSKILDVGRALIAGDFSFGNKPDISKSATAQTSIPIDPSNYRTPIGDGWAFSTAGGVYSYFKYTDRYSCTDAYTRCPGLNAVINRKAQAFINGETWVLDASTGSVSTGIYANQFRELLNNPNPFQTWDHFEAQMYIYVQVYGFCPILAIKPEGYKNNIDASMLWNIPPTMIDFHPTGKFLKQTTMEKIVDYVTINYCGEITQVSINDICIVRDLTIPTDNMPMLPDSRIRALEMPINNQIGAYESRNVLINFRGSLGIFSREIGQNGQIGVPPVTNEEKENLQKEFRRYGLRQNQWQYIITSAALKWQPISHPVKDLMLFEEVKGSNEAICDKFVYPFELLANEKGTTFDNRSEAGKDLYQNATIPEAKSIYRQLAAFFKLQDYGLLLDKDYSKVPVLQEDEKKRMDARFIRDQAFKIEWDNDLITRNQWRIANGEDAIEEASEDMTRSQLAALKSEPLVNSIGVGGVQGMIQLLTTPGVTGDMVQVFLEITFGVSPADARRFANAIPPPAENTSTNNAQTQ
jgi:hypothetical protein